MSNYTYKTKDGAKTGFVPGVGEIVDGKITSNVPIESPNLIEQTSAADEAEATLAQPVVGTSSQQNPNQPATADGAPTNAGVIQ